MPLDVIFKDLYDT
jgi:hypothetical protein